MAEYIICIDQKHHHDVSGLAAAIEVATKLSDANAESLLAPHITVTVENLDGYLLAAVTAPTRQIYGTFHKNEWGGPAGNTQVEGDAADFDATEALLTLSHLELMRLADDSDTAVAIGQRAVTWHGPCRVAVVDSLLQYFGVSNLEYITPEALEFARNRAVFPSEEEVSITVTLKVKVFVKPGADLSDFKENMDYSVVSNTDGIRVDYAELEDCN